LRAQSGGARVEARLKQCEVAQVTPDATQTVVICPRCEAMELFDPTTEGVALAERWLVEHECADDEPMNWASDT